MEGAEDTERMFDKRVDTHLGWEIFEVSWDLEFDVAEHLVEHAVADELHFVGRAHLRVQCLEHRLALVEVVQVSGLQGVASMGFVDSNSKRVSDALHHEVLPDRSQLLTDVGVVFSATFRPSPLKHFQ